MNWLFAAWGVFLVPGLIVVAVDVHGARRSSRLERLLRADRHDEVATAPLPLAWRRREGLAFQVVSAVLCGDYPRTLRLLEAAEAVHGPSTVPMSQLEAFRPLAMLELGRYAEAATLLGDDPADPMRRRLRAQVAIEQGDDDLALALLADPGPEPEDVAGGLRVLGDLHARRGRHDTGRPLLEQAAERYRALHGTMDGTEVDEGLCWTHLAESALRRGEPALAIGHATRGIELIRTKPHHASGLAYALGVAAEASARGGDLPRARELLAEAEDLASRTGSPSLSARLLAVSGELAAAGGHAAEARSALGEAAAAHYRLGELPEATRLRRRADEFS